VNDLDETYKRLAPPWAQEELAARYTSAEDRGARAIKGSRPEFTRALPTVAIALPSAATLNVAVYVLHMLRASTHGDLAERLIDNAERNARACASSLPSRVRARRRRPQPHRTGVAASRL
jgi:hypothetical protein